MTAISAKDIMTLRVRTNAGMMDAKRALQEASGDMEKAAELLRKWGAGRADAKMSNEMKEGLIGGKIGHDGKVGVLVRLSSQTDFVARNEAFIKILHDLVELAFANKVDTPAKLNALAWPDGSGRSVENMVKELAGGTIKENMAITGVARFESTGGPGEVGRYVHHNDKVGALVQVDGGSGDVVRMLARELAMHITAGMPFVPIAISRDKVDSAILEREKRIAAEGIAGKPPLIADKIIAGRLEKFFADNVLLEQPFVKDEKKRIRDILADASRAISAKLEIIRFARFKVGEV